MKKIITSLSAVLFSFAVSAQGIEIYLVDETVDVSGTLVELGLENLHQEFDVKNTTDATMTLKITRLKVVELDGTTDYLCWGANPESGACYSSSLVSPFNPWTTPDMSDLPAGDSGWLATYHVTEGNDGCARYRYYVVNDSDVRLDSVDVQFCSNVGIEKENKINVSVYPNPVAEIVTVSLDKNVNNIQFELYNILGDVVMSTDLGAGKNKLNVAKLPRGIYFYSILKDGNIIETKKLVINH